MAAKPLNIHPVVLAELKSALTWYLKRSDTAADKFTSELYRAIDLYSLVRNVGLPANAERVNSCSGIFLMLLSIGRESSTFRFSRLRMVIASQVIGRTVCEPAHVTRPACQYL